jgi:hypothetical protein
MKLTINPPVKSLSKAYLKQSLKRDQIVLYKANLARMFERIRTDEHEDDLKNIVSDFLKDTWYKQTNEINTSVRTDLVIHNGKSSSDTVGVLIEVKRPGNNNEMISPERPNYLNVSSTIQCGFVRFITQYMQLLPIPLATDAQQAPIIERVQKILAALDSPDVLQLEAEIDRLVFDLYGLTDEEIVVVEGKK